VYVYPLLKRPPNAHINLRNHRKMVIADGVRVFAGGMNVGLEYMGPVPIADRWIDLAYLLEGPAMVTFCDIFKSDWHTAGGTAQPAPSSTPQGGAGAATVQLVPSGPDTRDDPLHDAFVNAIHCATQRVWIVTPYFIPTEFLEKALILAARRGVDVRLTIPQVSNQYIADFARGAYLREMHDAGASIQFFQAGMIHAKAGIIDDMSYVGSVNFDVRSMLLNFETALLAYDPASVAVIAKWYRGLETNCITGMPPASFVRRVSEGVFRLGAPIL
jgi:cardiolipin synthase